MAGLIPFQLTPADYEYYDMVTNHQKEQTKEEAPEPEETLSEKLNKTSEENETADDDVSSEDFMKLMNLLSADEKEEKRSE